MDGGNTGPAQKPTTVLPVYMTQDRLTLAVLTLLLGGWLAFALTYPVVRFMCCFFIALCVCVCLKCSAHVHQTAEEQQWL